MKGKKTLFMAVVSCVIMFAAATGALALTPPEYVSVATAEDYLVSVGGVITYADPLLFEEDFLVKRISDLKYTVFETPGNAAAVYTKVVYTVNLNLKDLSPFTEGVAGLVVSDVTIDGIGDKEPTLVSASLTINGAAMNLDASKYITQVVYDAGTLSARVTLPSLESTYNDGDMVAVFVMFKTPVTGLTITGSDIGFPDYQLP